MIDLHMHIIPDVDDGSESLEMSEKMLLSAIEQGVEVVFATSHSFAFENNSEHTRQQYRKLKKLVKDKELPIQIYLGCEMLYDFDEAENILRDLDSGRIPSLNGTKYVLTELFYGAKEQTKYYLDLLLKKGWIPVLAHAERLTYLTIDALQELKEAGCLIQINAYSVFEESNESIKQKALALLDRKLVDFVGSDAHRLSHRPPAVARGIEYLYATYEKEYVDAILFQNARDLILAEEFEEISRERNIWLDGVLGLVVGDALGMPVQFLTRREVQAAPITEMDGFGTYNKPVGTWSDDSSMALATLASIREKKGIDYNDIMNRFIAWHEEGAYTPEGEAFDQGKTCVEAILDYERNRDYKTCGKIGEWANGNGALMRILPVCLYAYEGYKWEELSLEKVVELVHQVSALTHNHLRSKMACGIYFFMIMAILEERGSLMDRLQKGMDDAGDFYRTDFMNLVEWSRYGRLVCLQDLAATPEKDIISSGYVVDSLEAAVWSLVTTESFEEALLKAVNLGGDTDTIGAIAGGLGALYYGYSGIPKKWLKAIKKRDEIEEMCKV